MIKRYPVVTQVVHLFTKLTFVNKTYVLTYAGTRTVRVGDIVQQSSGSDSDKTDVLSSVSLNTQYVCTLPLLAIIKVGSFCNGIKKNACENIG